MLKVALLCAAAAVLNAHVCMFDPQQRGGWTDFGTPGSSGCFRPTGPCGNETKIPPEKPAVTYSGGMSYYTAIQQNLNHYSVGDPGFLDLAVAPMGSTEWTTLASWPDFWAHLQHHQQNFSVPVTMPNIDCPHCVLRVRYHPNKPTEPIFHNCADISITKSPSPMATNDFMMVFGGDASLSRDAASDIYMLNSVGKLETVATQGTDFDYFFVEGLTTCNSKSCVGLAKPALSTPTADLPALYVVQFAPGSKPPQKATVTLQTKEGPFGTKTITEQKAVSLSYAPDTNTWYMITTHYVASANDYFYGVRTLDITTGMLSDPIAQNSKKMAGYYVNFMWASDVHSNHMVALMGNENSLYTLCAELHLIDLSKGTWSTVEQNVTQYALGEIHWDGHSVWALAPRRLDAPYPKEGCYEDSKPIPLDKRFFMLQVNPVTGSVSPYAPLTAPNEYEVFYGGGVRGQFNGGGAFTYQLMYKNYNNGVYINQYSKSKGTLAGQIPVPTVNRELQFHTPILLADPMMP